MLSATKFLALLRSQKCKCLKTLTLIACAVHTQTCWRDTYTWPDCSHMPWTYTHRDETRWTNNKLFNL